MQACDRLHYTGNLQQKKKYWGEKFSPKSFVLFGSAMGGGGRSVLCCCYVFHNWRFSWQKYFLAAFYFLLLPDVVWVGRFSHSVWSLSLEAIKGIPVSHLGRLEINFGQSWILNRCTIQQFSINPCVARNVLINICFIQH